jgi:hypothetical protein
MRHPSPVTRLDDVSTRVAITNTMAPEQAIFFYEATGSNRSLNLQ